MVPRGTLTMLLGRNGAGKTTTLRTVMGLWHASAGNVRFNGEDITAWATPDIAQARHRLCAGDHGHLLRSHGAREISCWRPPAPGRSTRPACAGSSACSRRWRNSGLLAAGVLSGGQKQMLSIATRHHRAAQAVPDRRTDQGSGAGDHRCNIIAAFAEIKKWPDTTILVVEQNFLVCQIARRFRRRDGQRPDHSCRRHGRTRR